MSDLTPEQIQDILTANEWLKEQRLSPKYWRSLAAMLAHVQESARQQGRREGIEPGRLLMDAAQKAIVETMSTFNNGTQAERLDRIYLLLHTALTQYHPQVRALLPPEPAE